MEGGNLREDQRGPASAGVAWLLGRREISKHLGISVDSLDQWRERHPSLPVVVVDGQVRALREALDVWVIENAENRCPIDNSICAKAACRKEV